MSLLVGKKIAGYLHGGQEVVGASDKEQQGHYRPPQIK
jgi:hypothetical protein